MAVGKEAHTLAVALACALAAGSPVLAGCAKGQASSASGAQGSAASGSSAASGGSAASSASAATNTASDKAPVLKDIAVMRDTSFGGVFLDVTIDEFNGLGFMYGDSVDIVFSNGYQLSGIPYYNGYYVRVGSPLVVAYPGYPYVEVAINYGDPLWDLAGLTEGDTATVTLVERGPFRDVQESLDITYTNDRSDYATDEQFANFRALSGGTLRQGSIYRSASPIDNEYGRAPYVEDFMKRNGVAYILNLSDNIDEINELLAEDDEAGIDVSYFRQLQDSDRAVALDLSANYPSPTFAKKLADGLVEMSKHDGPYLVHCVEGKDRTGFVCAVLEALCGASYGEIANDYMTTFANYYGITKQSDPTKYEAILHLNLDGMLSFIAGVGYDEDLAAIDFAPYAREYLRSGGMTDEQIDALVARIS